MLCYRCGSYNADDARQCSECGASLGERRKAGAKKPGRPARGQPPLEPGQLLSERYKVADAIAQGTVGWVVRAHDTHKNRDVAVKIINPNLLQTEAEQAALAKTLRQARKVQHPNVAAVYEEGREDRYSYYTMPYLEGLTLRKIIDLRLEKEETFALSEVLPLISQLTQASDSWGKFGYHGAIRPSSVVVLPDMLKLTALPHHQGLPRKPFVVFQRQARAIEYLAPEARQDEGKVDARADIYSIAVIFAEMLTGVVFGRNDEAWTRAQAMLANPLLAVINTALSDTAAERFHSGQAFFESLADVVGGIDDEPTVPGVPVEVFDDDRVKVMSGDATDAEQRRIAEQETRAPARPDGPIRRRRRGGFPRALAAALVVLLGGAAVAGAQWYRYLRDAPPQTDIVLSGPKPLVDRLPIEPLAAPDSPEANPESTSKPAPEPPAETEAAKVIELPPQPIAEVEPLEPVDPEPVQPRPAPSVVKVERKPAPVARATKKSDDSKAAIARIKEESKKSPVVALNKPEPRPVAPPPPPAKPRSTEKSCPNGMVNISRGRFLMGTQPNDPMRGFGDLQVRYRNTGDYCIDRFEYPNKAGALPETGFTWSRAKRACESQGKRLCSEVEWERACKGPTNARFPFGNAFRSGACNVQNGGKPGPAGRYSQCKSGYGVADMAGNVAEWTASRWSSDIPDRVVKGGAADQAMHASRCSARINEAAGARGRQLGFRCCASLD